MGIQPYTTLLNTDMRDYYNIVYIIAVFIVILFVAYYISKRVGNFHIKRTNNTMKIVEVIPVGPQKTIQLIKVGNEFILIGVSKDRITYMKEVSVDSLGDEFKYDTQNVPFSKHFESFINKRKNSSETLDNGEGNDEK
jgi:flagellar protein FliO/FliZ